MRIDNKEWEKYQIEERDDIQGGAGLIVWFFALVAVACLIGAFFVGRS